MGQVVSQADLILRRAPWKADGHVVVCISGSFDLLHPGHIRLLEQARALGDILVVAVRSDATLRASDESAKIAGPSSVARPINPAAERMEILAALASVDYVVEFDDRSWSEFCSRLSPDVIVRGAPEAPATATAASANSRATRALKTEAVSAACRIETIAREPGCSTEKLIERITQQ